MDIRNFRVLLRTFERLLIKERRKPRFPKAVARSNFRVHPRTFERLLIKERRKPRFPKVGARL